MIIHEDDFYRRMSRINRKLKEHEKEQDDALMDIQRAREDFTYYSGTGNKEKAKEANKRLQKAITLDKKHSKGIAEYKERKDNEL
jgi:hypothetical protein